MLNIWYCGECKNIILKTDEVFLPYLELKCSSCKRLINTYEIIKENKKILTSIINNL